MKPIILSALALATLGASAGEDLQTALTSGKANLEIRTRYEYNEDGNGAASKSATGLTNRTILGYKTGDFYGVKANLQFLDVSTLFDVDRFNSGFNNQSKSATISEPHQDRILEGYLEWKGLKVGRQTLQVDNGRFIGGGAWSQSPKSFTGATFKGSFGLSWMELHAGYADKIVQSDNTNRDAALRFARIRFTPCKAIAITPFYYSADVTTYTAPTLPTATTTNTNTSYQHRGLRADGSWKGLLYEASFAKQGAYRNGTATFVPDALYRMGMIGYKYQASSIKVVRESLEGNYKTPDASLHGYYGYSDRIGATPANGLVDTYLQAETKFMGASIEAQYHWFKAQKDVALDNYGKELDLQVNYPVTKSFSVLAKFADYRGDGEVTTSSYNLDLRKFWLQTTYKF